MIWDVVGLHMARKQRNLQKSRKKSGLYLVVSTSGWQDAFFSSFGHLKVLKLSQNKLLGTGRGRISWRSWRLRFLVVADFVGQNMSKPHIALLSPQLCPIFCDGTRSNVFVTYDVFASRSHLFGPPRSPQIFDERTLSSPAI